jgi:hypothetical protein
VKPIPIGDLHKYLAGVGKPGELDAIAAAEQQAHPPKAKPKHRAEHGVTYRKATLEMNRTEQKYWDELETLRWAGKIISAHFKAIKLRLAPSTFIEPDFLVFSTLEHTMQLGGGSSMRFPVSTIELHEVKGHWEDDSRAKFKIAAAMYPRFRFRAFSPRKMEVDGGTLFHEERWE